MTERHMTWDTFRETFLETGVPAVHVIHAPGRPDAKIMVDSGGSSLSLLLPSHESGKRLASSLAAVQIRHRLQDGDPVVEVSTTHVPLFQPFYAFMLDVVSRFHSEARAPSVAITDALTVWRRLLRGIACLSPESQIGLLGELWALERLARSQSEGVTAAWVGPLGEPHDLRWQGKELEVKTTYSVDRSHVINGLSQLLADDGHTLWLLSLQMAPSGCGAGISLVSHVDALRISFADTAADSSIFEELLVRAGYHDEDASMYATKYHLRRPAALVPVDALCPRLTPEMLTRDLGQLASRVTDVHYRVNLSNLGHEDGTPEFTLVLPPRKQ